LYPPKAPIIIDTTASIGIIVEVENIVKNRGAIFWMVARMAFVIQDSPSITWGSQKCRGAAPIFKIRAATMIRFWSMVHVCSVRGVVTIGTSIIAEASAWVRKYFSIASFVVLLFCLARMGTKARALISSPAHAANQEEEEVVITMPISINAINKTWVGMLGA
jgi:hypothetical protein